MEYTTHSSVSFVQVYRFEFATWKDQCVIEYNLPMVFFFRLMIRGDLVMIHMPHSVQLTLLNWKTGSVLLLNFTNSKVSKFQACMRFFLQSLTVVCRGAEQMPEPLSSLTNTSSSRCISVHLHW